MRLSNKSTFSLVCFIVLLAFATIPVMAHAPGDNTVGQHTHPVNTAIPATDHNGDGDTDDAGEAAVPTHNAHPVPMISLPDDTTTVTDGVDGMKVRIVQVADIATTTDVNEDELSRTFMLEVDFGQPVVGTAAQRGVQTAVTDDDDATTETDPPTVTFTTIVLDKNLGTIANGIDSGFPTVARKAGSTNVLIVTIRVAEVALPDGLEADGTTANAALDEIRIRIGINATGTGTGVYSLATVPAATEVPGGASLSSDLSDLFEITLVDDLGEDEVITEDVAPTVMITSELNADDTVTFKFVFSEPVSFGSGDIDVENGTKGAFGATAEANTYTLVVTPDSDKSKVTVKIAADSVMDSAMKPLAATSSSYTPEGYVPTIMITAADGTGDDAGKIVFTISFSETPDSFGIGNIGVTNGNLLKLADLEMATDPVATYAVSYMLTVTPTDAAAAVTVTIQAGAVMAGTDAFDSAQTSHTVTADDDDGDDTAMDPDMPANIFKFSIPAESYVVLVRNKTAAIGATPPIGQNFSAITDINGARVIPDAKIIEWAAMPNLQELFDRSATGGGGALILRKAVGDSAAPAVGTVGISEILWAIDVSEIGQASARDSQWIEIHNLNTTAKSVLIYAQTGDQFTNSDKLVVDTQAGDRIYGKLGDANETKMVVDVMTNYFNGSDRGNAGWDVPGSNGSSRTGINFVSMARQPKRGSFHLTRRHENKNDKPLDGLYNNAKGAENSLDGRSSGSWAASTVRYETQRTEQPASATTQVPTVYDFIGTPGRSNTHSVQTHITKDSRTSVPSNSVIINEVANRNDTFQAYEWIELRNVSGSEINLRNYLISIVTANDDGGDKKDRVLYQFPANDAAKIAAGGVFLLVASDPRNDASHPLAVGYNVDINDEEQAPGTRKNPVRYKVAHVGNVPGFGNGRNAGESVTTLPDDGKFVLILRRPDNGEGHRSGADGGKGVAERGKDDLDKIVDIAGYHPNLKQADYSNKVSSTDLWPLRAFRSAGFNLNQFTVDTVHFRQRGAHGLGGVNDGASGVGAHENKNEGGKAAWRNENYSGIGYKRQVAKSNVYGGSPGYHGNVSGRLDATTNPAKVIISEVMLSQGNGRTKLPQWIELYNPSKTHAVNLTDNAGWRLVIENPNRAPIITIHFKSNKHDVKTILPNQTVLIVSSSARDYGSDTLHRGTVFPPTRVLNAYTVIKGETFELASRTAPLLDPEAFNIRLLDGKTTNNKADGRYAGEVSDEVGNLDGNPRTNDTPAWKFEAGMTEDGNRTSLIRIFDDGVARSGTGMVKPLGGTDGEGVDGMPGIDAKYSWVHAVDTEDFDRLFVRHTWYGAETDYGTPADRTGQILPVELSFFRPTLHDGKVTIRWTTESELDNAGFNILRSEERNGEYKQVNTELIQGAGTTGERTTYDWVDATAKPGVVYYYQIEDVSFAGEHQVLATTKLKGLISATNKLTTTWGELKEVQ